MPDEARSAWRQIETFGTPADLDQTMLEITRILINTQYEIAVQKMAQEAKTDHLGSLETEDDLMTAAISLTE